MNTKKLLISALLVIASLTTAGANAKVNDMIFTINVDSRLTSGTGSTVLHELSGETDLDLTAPGFYQVNVPSTVQSVTLGGQVIVAPNPGPATLSTGQKVQVQWQANGIEIIDIDAGA